MHRAEDAKDIVLHTLAIGHYMEIFWLSAGRHQLVALTIAGSDCCIQSEEALAACSALCLFAQGRAKAAQNRVKGQVNADL